jgi:hypothetical protein
LGRLYKYDFVISESELPGLIRVLEGTPKGQRSKVIRGFLADGYRMKRHYFENINYNDPSVIQDLFESLLPRITEPISSFRFENDRERWRLTNGELLDHFHNVGVALIDGHDKTLNTFGGAYGSVERDEYEKKSIMNFIERFKDRFPSEEARQEHFERKYNESKQARKADMISYITEKAKEPTKTARQLLDERIAEKEDELHALIELRDNEKHQQEQEPSQTNPEISQQ